MTGVNAVGEVFHSHSEAIQRTPNRLVWILLFPTLLNTLLLGQKADCANASLKEKRKHQAPGGKLA